MNYHVHRDGKELGHFPLEELQRRRASGELKGDEMVWTKGMAGWQPLNSVIPPLPPTARPSASQKSPNYFALAAIVAGVLLVSAVAFGVIGYRLLRPAMKQLASQGSFTESTAMAAASKPVLTDTNTLTAADAMKMAREFRMRQYVEGYQSRGIRNPECDAAALGLISNWIACNYEGIVDTNQPSLSDLSDRLANDPACTDPLVLTVAAVNAMELHESLRRLERAVKGFENSKHLGYPKFYATETLADKLINDRPDRLPVLDAEAMRYLKDALTDGGVRPTDQAELAEILVFGWGEIFFNRNAAPVVSLVQAQSKKFQWLALVLEGQHEISEAWRVRGGGYANSVSEIGWQGFNQHMASARQCLTRAWELQPNLPLAPSKMIYVSLGDAGIGEMRLWFDRATAAQIDYADAWNQMRWGLRPRWYGDTESMLAFGVTALNTRRFDTDVPRKFIDSVYDVESELKVASGQHIFDRDDVWPHLKELYEGYIALPSQSAWARDGWRSTYSVIACIAGKYDVAREQLQALNWQPHAWSLTGWARDLTLLAPEVAARTGPQAKSVTAAEDARESGDIVGALKSYDALAAATGVDELTRQFARERQFAFDAERRLQAGEWIPFLPADSRFIGWQTNSGNFKLVPGGALEVSSDQNGHMLYSRVRVGREFEVRGQFEVVSSTSTAFQAGLVMGVPQRESDNWFAFRVKRNSDEGDVASFSQSWTKRQILAPISNLDSRTNYFEFRFRNGRVNATLNGREVFKEVEPPRYSHVTTNEFFLGLGAFNDSNSTVIRYHDIEVRSLAAK